ncbi:hypothetical protein [Cohnella rhizosphaerae]|uniref:Uncharacterized protein n=1 Tax=Cohnella rhizosphaerae TaxID=1457232 RepID=A0A9X4KXV6_9BACL|nr:hypothetical protein [Cohnella rhizosphaerae]MDG0812870.1 hypothetical protein [Cohnella rhizosphaerae]
MLLTYSAIEIKKEIKSFKSLQKDLQENEIRNAPTKHCSTLNGKEVSALNKVVFKSDGVTTAGYWN